MLLISGTVSAVRTGVGAVMSSPVTLLPHVVSSLKVRCKMKGMYSYSFIVKYKSGVTA